LIGSTPPSRLIATPRGEVRLRAEREGDGDFLRRLFAANRAGLFGPDVPAAMAESLIAMQHRAQTLSYRLNFPDARFWIAELGSEPIGRYIEHDENEAIDIIDIALLPEFQQRGIGSALVRSTQQLASSSKRCVRAMVLSDNDASLKMFRRLEFTATDKDEVHLHLVWPASRP